MIEKIVEKKEVRSVSFELNLNFPSTAEAMQEFISVVSCAPGVIVCIRGGRVSGVVCVDVYNVHASVYRAIVSTWVERYLGDEWGEKRSEESDLIVMCINSFYFVVREKKMEVFSEEELKELNLN